MPSAASNVDNQSLRSFLHMVETEHPDDLLRVPQPVDPRIDMTAVVFELERAGRSPVVIFEKPGANAMPVVTNVAANRKLLAACLGAVPVLAQWPIYPAANPGKGYPSYEDFGEGYLLTKPGMDWFEDCYAADTKDWRYNPMVKSQKGMPPTLVLTASLDPIRDQGRAYAAACIQAGVPTVFREAEGNIHGFINLRKAIPSSQEDVSGCIAALKLLLGESA